MSVYSEKGFEVYKISYIAIFTWSSSMFINVKSKLCNVCTLCPIIRANSITNFNGYQRQFNIFTPTEVDIIELLTMLYKSGVGYSSINTARSTIVVEIFDWQ
jgi:hypothetical protein